ncbi:HAD family hydrolase [Amedibacillus sp. YH-ame6]
MIKNIVFDIGNVLVTFHPMAHFLPHFKDEEKTKQLCHQVFSHDAWGWYDQGLKTMDELHEIYQETYPIQYEDISYILQHWLPLMKFMPETFAYMKELKTRGFHLYLLSNISKDSADYLKGCMPFFEIVDGEILSYAYKVNKPDVKIYQALFDTYSLIPEETIFFDDNLPNIEQANRLKVHGVLFENLEDAKKKAEEIIGSLKLC